MGRRGVEKKKGPSVIQSMTLREQSSGKKQGNVKPKYMCKLDHLKNLAMWAAEEASIPSLGAFFGERFAATGEALGIRPDPSFFVCERCKSILQPGHNCTVRIEKNKSKAQRRFKKPKLTTEGNVVYKCHFCSHRNLIRGTSKGYVKEICPPKPKPAPKVKIAESAILKRCSIEKATKSKVDFVDLPPVAGQNLETTFPSTPLQTPNLSLLDSKRKKRNRSTAKLAEPETTTEADKSIPLLSKRRKKSWMSLKEIAESSADDTGNKLTKLKHSILYVA